ncbi:hypothetical protein [Stigmatella erecta]|uniref:Uncharacterized protein n=1 Tax=Stigmatella erecta TaxID=83460 RepID=A0A1I0JA53_9BACT|nr:hypothetical protein [Stigmatella erecta]SEU06773.1 hypothetical protein SAMN05443639_10790 [Stigmatella erecta]
MHRIDSEGSIAGKYTNGDEINDVEATVADADHMNAIQESICTVIEREGITLVKGDDTQLGDALDQAYGRKDVPNAWEGKQTFPGGVGLINSDGPITADGEIASSGAITADGTLGTKDGLVFLQAPTTAPSVPLSNKLVKELTCKAWGTITVSGGIATLNDGANVASVSVSGSHVQVDFAAPMANALYDAGVEQEISAATTKNVSAGSHSKTTAGFKISAFNSVNDLVSPAFTGFTVTFRVFGRQ